MYPSPDFIPIFSCLFIETVNRRSIAVSSKWNKVMYMKIFIAVLHILYPEGLKEVSVPD